MYRLKKGQSSIELIILVGAFAFFFLTFLLIVQRDDADEQWKRRNLLVKEIALQVQKEVYLASESIDGYYRKFYIPPTLLGLDYDVIIQDGSIYIHTLDNRHALSLPALDVIGTVQLGENIIQRIDGIIYLN